MAPFSRVFNGLKAYPYTWFFCRVLDKEEGFEIELFNMMSEEAWTSVVTPKTLELYDDSQTRIPIDTAEMFLKAGITALSKGQPAENAIVDITESVDEVRALKLSLRFTAGGCCWCPDLHFILHPMDAERKEKIELRAVIAATEAKVDKMAFSPRSGQRRGVASPAHSQFCCSSERYVCGILLAAATVLAIVIAILVKKTNFYKPTAFASMKPLGVVRAHDNGIIWKSNQGIDDKIFSSSYAGLTVNRNGLAHVSIGIRHSNCRSNIAFKVYASGKEVARVFDYTCGLFSQGITTMYVQTIPVKVNDKLSVKYVGGGKLYAKDSFMDVLLLPPSTQ
ncbi:hypothetical protein PHYBOEH_011861 [Phytophthora boehmeriae]|uniref:Uncharacterized protein n=1 Tax=Phytophthora boehmeriae TaxID=109152 RepID=A0A8T1X279_9STRA|nr:hypothetical protein PHYBOEH_011861 [Phytophthora boehmeriae]